MSEEKDLKMMDGAKADPSLLERSIMNLQNKVSQLTGSKTCP